MKNQIMKQRILSKNEFVKIMTAIQRVMNYSNELNDVFDKYDCSVLFQPDCIDQTIDLLEFIFHDEKTNWISNWIFELDFGKDYTNSDIEGENGEIVVLNTVDDLYDFLVRNMEELESKEE